MQEAFEVTPELLRSHADALRALARRLLKDDDAAEDVLQDTWLMALRHPPARQDSLGGWLRTVTRSLALKRLRGESRRARREERSAVPEAVDGPVEAQTAEERARIFRSVTEAVLGLEEPYRNTVLRRYFEDLPPREIARSEGVPVSTVKSRLQRAYARLRARLSRDLDADAQTWTKALALCFGLPAPALPVPLSEGGTAAGEATTATGSPLSLTAIMAAKTSILAIGGALSLVALLVWRVSDGPASPVRQPIGSEARPDLARAGLAPTGASTDAAEDGVRKVLPAPGEESSERIWPAAEVPGPAHVFALAGQVVDENDLPVGGAQVYLGPLGHPLNRVATADEGGRFLVKWFGRASAMDVAFCAKGSGGAGAIQKLRLTGGVENALRTTVPNQETFALTAVSFTAHGDEGAWAEGLLQEEEARKHADDLVADRTAQFLVQFAQTSSGPLDGAPTALVDEAGFTHFVGLDDPVACPADLYRQDSLRLLDVQAAALQAQMELVELTSTRVAADTLVVLDDMTLAVAPAKRDFVQVRGVVLDARGEPLKGVLVARLGASGQPHDTTTTDEDGAFLLDELPPGDLRLRAGGGNHGLALAAFTASAGQALHWEPILERGREVRGRLVDSDGQGLPGWPVVAVAQDTAARWSDVTVTDEKGFFAVPNCPDQGMSLFFSDPEADGPFPNLVVEDVWPDTTPEPFAVPASQLARSAFEITVLDARGEPVPSALVRLWHLAAGAGTRVQPEDDEGLFRMEGLPPGEYRVEIGSSRHGWLELPGVWIADGQDADLGVVAFPEPGRLAFEVDVRGKENLEDLRVEIWKEHADVRNRVRSIEGIVPPPLLLPDGDYVATARSRAGASTRPFSLEGGGESALSLVLGNDQTALGSAEFDPVRFEQRLAEPTSNGPSGTCTNCHLPANAR